MELPPPKSCHKKFCGKKFLLYYRKIFWLETMLLSFCCKSEKQAIPSKKPRTCCGAFLYVVSFRLRFPPPDRKAHPMPFRRQVPVAAHNAAAPFPAHIPVRIPARTPARPFQTQEDGR